MTYTLRNKGFLTICSVHNELDKIFKDIYDLKIDDYNTVKELYEKILTIISESIELVKIATDMGQRMENSLKVKKEYAPFSITELGEFDGGMIKEEESE